MAQLRVATWNIGAGILGESHQENGEEELTYHIDLIRRHDPDILCLQEAHDYLGAKESQTAEIAREAGYEFTHSVPISPSHLGSDAHLALGILSKYPISDVTYTQFPNPNLSATGPGGNEWVLFDKGYATCAVSVDGEDVSLVNAHCFPLHYFNASPTEARFEPMWREFSDRLLALRSTRRTVATIDLNHEPIDELLPAVLAPDLYVNAFTAPTIPKGIQQDYVLYDSAFALAAQEVLPTQADHSYCQVVLQL
ncbi:endonuclease/exonuclease/phosphatase family protein [Micromonospora sp. NPDC007208]|uniref:endonuclease/exonuclease/phosphatase family protein n=1 Tax=Micromonospora sp. NPDC007208 TaxID=3364236 RepID=UPI00368FA9F2